MLTQSEIRPRKVVDAAPDQHHQLGFSTYVSGNLSSNTGARDHCPSVDSGYETYSSEMEGQISLLLHPVVGSFQVFITRVQSQLKCAEPGILGSYSLDFPVTELCFFFSHSISQSDVGFDASNNDGRKPFRRHGVKGDR